MKLIYIYKNELHKTCFTHNMFYGAYKDLLRRTASNKVVMHLKLLVIQSIMDNSKDLPLGSTHFLTKNLFFILFLF